MNYAKNFNSYVNNVNNNNNLNEDEEDESSDDDDIDIKNLINGYEDNCIVDGDEHVAYDNIEYERSSHCNPFDYL